MITLISSLSLLGFYMFYSTSKRAPLTHKFRFQKWLNNNVKISKYIATCIFLISLIFCIFFLGLGAGIFSFIVILMTVGSLVVLIMPLRFINLSTVLILTILSFGIEIYLT